MKSKSKLLILAVMAAILVASGTLFAPVAFAAHHVTHSVDSSLFTDIVSSTDNGTTGAIWGANVVGNTDIQFILDLAIKTNPGNQSYPQTVTYGVTTTTGPAVPTVYFGGNNANTNFTFSAANSSSGLSEQVNIIAPAVLGAYTVTIYPTGQTGSNPQLSDGYGITIGFTVISSSCTAAPTSLSLSPSTACVVYKEPSTKFTATLTSNSTALEGKPIDFTIAFGLNSATSLGTVSTDANGEAQLVLDTSIFTVGGYTITASFQGDECYFEAEPAIASLGVKYDFLGFQPPVQIDGVGAGLFSGKVIPVKLIIADFNAEPVPDATAYITWSAIIGDVSYADVDVDSVSAADTGNMMRYDPLADQYIYNWDTSKLDNGTYTLNIGMGEGCEENHNATVILQKNSGKKK